jgi:type I restriction enzyme R subunit
MKVLKEIAFEDAIEEWLLEHGGYIDGVRTNYDPAVALDIHELFAFIEVTQSDEWNRLVELQGSNKEDTKSRFIDRVVKQIDQRGTLDVLRHGLDDLGVHFDLAYFKPVSGLNPDLQARYDANRLTVTRQLAYAPGSANELDLCLFVNGLPVATAELKNPFTHQNVEHAIAQYRSDRDPKDTLLGRRALVHFAVDPDLVMMTTRLAGAGTRFLPFNRGRDPGGKRCGKGNPPNHQGYATAYLWEWVWQRDAWLDILHHFIHIEPAEPGKRAKSAWREGTIIFPRFHQWDAVRKLEAAARDEGPGHNYLVEHSAGSGKSNTIAWLAHRLASLHDAADNKVFAKVVVITDRKVLDKQLQDTIYQFEHAHGVVAKIEESSKELAEALRAAEAKIIVTTLQKFPFVVDEIAELPELPYAVIIDEAHSSQTGETAGEMKRALGGIKVAEGADGDIDAGDAIAAKVEARTKARGPQRNLSLFAFTATPKGKTLELFGRPDEDGLNEPFHLYSMRQAIEEVFIMDVLAQYTTYETYFRLARAGEEDPEVEARKASKAIARFASLHPAQFAQKAEIIVEHFRRITKAKIGGKGKAMVVCRSRLHAVRMKLAIDSYIRDHGYGDIETLVAFSGVIKDPDVAKDFSEANLNGFPEKETVERFKEDRYRIMVVAEKFQMGFDQPLLHTMFVDKNLIGVNAVQTLSRLNRIHPDKEDTFVLDFDNDAEQIRSSFEPYYDASLGESTDPNELWDAWNEVDRFGVVLPVEVDDYAELYFGGDPNDKTLQGKLYARLDSARDRFTELDVDSQEECRTWLKRFVSRYAFLSQVIPYGDTEMEKRYQYCRHLLRRLPKRENGALDLGDQVALTHLRVAKTGDHRVSVDKGGGTLRSFGGGGPGGWEDSLEPLSEVIQRINEAFGLKLTDADRLHLEGIASDMAANPTMQRQAAVNTRDNFGLEFDREFLNAVAARLDQARDLTGKILDERDFREGVRDALLPRVYEKARVGYQKVCPIGELLERDEDQHLEFKSTLRWDLKNNTKSKLVESATIKTAAAFLNSRYGGTLLIGVEDSGEVVGLENDYATLRKESKRDSDLFELHLNQLIENAVGLAAAANVSTQIHHVDGHDICRVHVEPSGHPVEAEVMVADQRAQFSKKKVFFIRLNNATRVVEDEDEKQKYIFTRWTQTQTSLVES